jgi:hypothetical protein
MQASLVALLMVLRQEELLEVGNANYETNACFGCSSGSDFSDDIARGDVDQF